MLELVIEPMEFWDEATETFIEIKGQTLRLEHSLVSISKWESKWHKPFLSDKEKTKDETIDYIKCMTLTQNVNPDIYNRINQEHIHKIKQYIEDPMTATTINRPKNGRPNREQVTAELIYYWMIALNIPVEFQKWHLNKLLMLVEVCNIKNQPPKKMSKNAIKNRNAALNAARRQQLNSKG